MLEYEIGNLVNENKSYKVFSCSHGKELLLLQTGEVSLNAWRLRRLEAIFKHLQRDLQNDPHKKRDVVKEPNHDYGFPELVDELEETGLQAPGLILRFKDIDDISTVIPLIKFIKSSTKVDINTNAWILQQLLKIISFAHYAGLAIGKINGNNVLIEPNKQRVIIFDWSHSYKITKKEKEFISKKETAAAARLVKRLLSQKDAYDNEAYMDLLQRLENDGSPSVKTAYDELTFYITNTKEKT